MFLSIVYVHSPIVSNCWDHLGSNYALKPRPFQFLSISMTFSQICFRKNIHFHHFSQKTSGNCIPVAMIRRPTAKGKFHTLRGVLEDHHLERVNFARRTPMKVALACAAGRFRILPPRVGILKPFLLTISMWV